MRDQHSVGLTPLRGGLDFDNINTILRGVLIILIALNFSTLKLLAQFFK